MVPVTLELTRQVDGVVDVIDHLTSAHDDTTHRPEPAYVAVLRDPRDHAARRQAERGAPPA
jgi:hypothetical protein